MEMNQDTLRDHYKHLSDDELIELNNHRETMTDIAKPLLQEELKTRGYAPSDRDGLLAEDHNIHDADDTSSSLQAEGFKNSQGLTNWVHCFLYIQIALAIVSMVSGYMEYQLLSDYQNGVYTSQEQAVADGEASDLRQRIIAILYTIVLIVSGVLILKWIYRANYNARQLGAEGMAFTPGWSIGWYFVPIAALWKPYQAMKEIWMASHFPRDWNNASVSSLLPWWWFLWLVYNFLANVAFRMSLRAKEIEELMNANLMVQASDIASIPLSIVTLVLVLNIYKTQVSYKKYRTRGNLLMFCPNCGIEIHEQAKFCRECGASMLPMGMEHNAKVSQSSPVQQQTSGFAISSLVLGILGVVIGWFTLVIPAILAVIFGHIARSKIRQSGGTITGDGMAIAGLVMGYLVFSIIIISILAAVAIPSYSDYIVKSQIRSLDSDIRDQVKAYVDRAYSLPSSTSELDLSLDSGLDKIVSSINVDSIGRITVTFSSPKAIKDQNIIYEPIKGQNTVDRWVCTGGTLKSSYRPIKCRE